MVRTEHCKIFQLKIGNEREDKQCLSAIEMILGNDIAIGVYEDPDLDLEEIMKDEAWDNFGFAIFEHEGVAI
ncbi:hypothetical protein EE765_14740 [Listeria monocytogenes]|nr:hypothetical protein [Listeria monocytogenes]